MGVSKNRGTPKWMVYNGKPYQNGWFGGTTIFENIHIMQFEGELNSTTPTRTWLMFFLCQIRGNGWRWAFWPLIQTYQFRRKPCLWLLVTNVNQQLHSKKTNMSPKKVPFRKDSVVFQPLSFSWDFLVIFFLGGSNLLTDENIDLWNWSLARCNMHCEVSSQNWLSSPTSQSRDLVFPSYPPGN